MKIGIIGGSGLYDMDGLDRVEDLDIDTPFGSPSDSYMHARVDDRDVYFLPRHGSGHSLLPAEINHRANIYGFKVIGVDRVISICAVGSLREEHRPRDVVLPDQYFDRTKSSMQHTFCGNGVVAHVSFGEPACAHLRGLIAAAAEGIINGNGFDNRLKADGTYVNMEGPAFSTKAESRFYRSMECDVIGMTSLGEARLCREAEICYQNISMVTDYDCWRDAEEDVSVDMVIGNLKANTKLAKEILRKTILSLPEERNCSCGSAMAHALMSSAENLSDQVKKDLAPIIGPYLK